MHRLRLTLAAAAAVTVFSVTAAGASSGAITPDSPSGQTSAALTGKQKKAKRKALRNCARKSSPIRRKACRKRVNKKFAPKAVEPVPEAPAATIDVRDDYFSPDVVNIKSGDTILWVWNDLNHDPHDITPLSGPPGVDLADFRSSGSPAVGATFSRKFTVPGTYVFRCSLHFKMSITVNVS